MARRYWPAGHAVGGRISLENRGATDPKWITVIGIAGDIHRAIGDPAPLLLYLPAMQASGPFSGTDYLMVRAAGNPDDLAPDLRAMLRDVDAGMPITRIVSMRSHVGATLMAHRLGLTLFVLFAALSALLTGLGLYAVVASAVAARTREIGIRVALGAEISTVLRLVARQGLMPVAGGLAIGLAAFVLSAQLIRQFMFSLPVTSPGVMAMLTIAISALAGVAMLVPARRALRINPVTALRNQ